MDSVLEAFSRNPTDGTFTVLAFQLAAFTQVSERSFPLVQTVITGARTGLPVA